MRSLLNFLCLCGLFLLAKAQILAIDFGTQYVKTAFVSSGSGKSFQIVLTNKSERKFLNSVGFYNEERHYESESLTKRPRFPTNCFIFNKLLVDSVLRPQLKSTISKDLFMEFLKEETHDPLTHKFYLDKFSQQNKEVSLVEVVAMLLKYSKQNAETQFKTSVKDVILTVPNYWNIRMRAFLIEAAQVADLYVLSVISENTGAALNYALNQRTKNTTETILFYNVGSNSMQMTLAQFKQVSTEKSSKPVESIFILGDYGEPYVGGLRFDTVVFNYFKSKFQSKYKKELTKRAQVKLFHESNSVKQILSSNKESQMYVEGIMDGIDYQDKITRTEFEELSAPLLEKLTAPIRRFLLDHDLKPEDLDGVELVGGCIRIPKLQSMVSEIIGNQSKMGQHINGDQAMVLGAAFYGVNSSKKFKVKGFNLYDGFNFQVRAVLRNLEEGIAEEDEGYFFKNVTIFPKKSRFGMTKQLNFKCKQNIIVDLYREDENGLFLLRSDKIDNINKVNQTDFKVSITLGVDPVDVVLIKKVQILYKREQIQTYVQKVKKDIQKSEEKDENDNENQETENQEAKKQEEEIVDEKEKEEQEQNDEDNVKESADQNSEQNTQQKTEQEEDEENKNKKTKQKPKKKKKKQPKIQYETVQRNRTVTKKYQKDLNMVELFSMEKIDQLRQDLSRKLLKNYERVEQERNQLSESKNKLEGLIYEIREKLQMDDFLEYVQESEKEKLTTLIQEKLEWQDETDSNEKSDFDSHYKELNKPVEKIKRRIDQFYHRPQGIIKAGKDIDEYRQLSKNITKKKSWITEEEVDELLQKIDKYQQELQDMVKQMKETPKNKNPPFLIKDFSKVIEKAKDEYFKLMATPKPKKQTKKEKQSDEERDEADESESL